MTYYQNMEFENELPSFGGFFKRAHYDSGLVFAGYQTKQDLLDDFEQKFAISGAYNKSKLSTTGSSRPWKIPRNFKKGRETISASAPASDL